MSRIQLALVDANDPILEEVIKPYSFKTSEYNASELVSAMTTLMLEHRGVGLAAPQVGINASMFVMSYIGFFNPVYIDPPEGTVINTISVKEGCLSLPGVKVITTRAQEVTIRYNDCFNKRHVTTFSGREAVIVQHEMDHLQGLLITRFDE